MNKSGGGGLLVHHPVTPKKRVVTKTKTDHLSDELNLGYRQVLCNRYFLYEEKILGCRHVLKVKVVFFTCGIRGFFRR